MDGSGGKEVEEVDLTGKSSGVDKGSTGVTCPELTPEYVRNNLKTLRSMVDSEEREIRMKGTYLQFDEEDTQEGGADAYKTPKNNSKKYQAKVLEALSKPYRPSVSTKFSERIASFPFPPKVRMPNTVEKYTGMEDPEDHLLHFSGAAEVEQWAMPVWCHMFVQTLTGAARAWFDKLKDSSIDSFEELRECFLTHYMQRKRYTKDPVEIHNIKQKEGESIKTFMERYLAESLDIPGADEAMKVSGFMHGLKSKQLIERLNNDIPKTVKDMMERTTAYVRGKEASSRVDEAASKKQHHPNQGQQWRPKLFPRKTFQERRASSAREIAPYPPPRRVESFTILTKTPGEILATEEARFSFTAPPPMMGAPEKRNLDKYCDFHADKGHHTNDCWQLKRQIEDAVRSGQLAHLVKEVRQGAQKQPITTRLGPNPRNNKNQGAKGKEVNMTWEVNSHVGDKRQRHYEWMDQEIIFPPVSTIIPSTDPLLVKGRVGNQMVHRMFVDGGSASEIIYEHCFLQLDPRIRTNIVKADYPLVGFSGETSWPVGTIQLPVTFGEYPCSRTVELNFAIIRSASRYNMLIGRPAICLLRAVVSTVHASMKFPTPHGVAELRTERPRMLECQEIERRDQQAGVLAREGPEEKIVINPLYPDQPISIGSQLSRRCKDRLQRLLRDNIDVFAWTTSDMVGVPRSLMEHRLNVHSSVEPIKQKKRGMAPERSKIICEEVNRLVEAGILREARYQSWVANPVLVKKGDGSWRMCVDFTDINKACPMDCYPLPEIDLKVDSIVGFKLKCFLDAYKGYHQIQMAREDEDKTAFHTAQGVYCYKKMPFGLRNAGASYQRLIDKVFKDQIGRNLEAYVDDIVIKSHEEEEMIYDISETFQRLRGANMKLNPKKCTFGVEEGKFLGHMITKRGIKASPDKVKAILEMKEPKNVREIQSLNGKLAALSRYLAGAAEKTLPFCKILKKCFEKEKFEWTIEADWAFAELKKSISELPMLVAPVLGEALVVYLAASNEAISSVLLTEREGKQLPVYFISRTLKPPEKNYAPIEKLCLCLVHTARRLRRYFQAHPITVVTEYPLKQVLHKPEISGRLAKWAIELGEHNIIYRPRTSMKAQILADFMAEVPSATIIEPVLKERKRTKREEARPSSSKATAPYEEEDGSTLRNQWLMHTDGSSNEEGSGAGIILQSPEGEELTYALRFNFETTNNEAEYEALLAGLQIAQKLQVKRLRAYVDSMLVANQINKSYEAKDPNMQIYLLKATNLIKTFDECVVEQISRSKNKKADTLSKLASLSFSMLSRQVMVETMDKSSLEEIEIHTVIEEEGPTWMTPIKEYLERGTLPEDHNEARKLERKAVMYTIEEGTLFKRSYLVPLLRCVGPLQANYVVREVHMGSCGMHCGPRAAVAKIMQMGYYWPTMHRDALEEIRKCDSCQIHAPVPKLPKSDLISITAPWPFCKWGIDIVGPFPIGPGGVKFLLVAIDYFTKWVEAKPLASITGKQVKQFVWENIVCRFGLPQVLISDNGKQFADNPLKKWCEKMKIKQMFTSVAHPQANGQVERANRSIVEGLKTRLGRDGTSWSSNLPNVLWAHRTMIKTSNGMSPFSLTYGSEAVIPAEIGMPTSRSLQIHNEDNDIELGVNLVLVEELREIAAIREAKYKRKMEQYYNNKVKGTRFQVGEFVYRKNEASRIENDGKMGPKWEGPYKVVEAHQSGAYKIAHMDGTEIPRTWNGMNLRKCYI